MSNLLQVCRTLIDDAYLGRFFVKIDPAKFERFTAVVEDTARLIDPDEANREQIIAAARAQYEHEGSVEIDDGAVFSRGEDAGLYVAAWVWVPDECDDTDYQDMTEEKLAEVMGSFSVDDGPAGEFDNLLAAINACKDVAATNNTFSYVYEHCAGTKHDVWEVNGRDSGGDEADGEETKNKYNVELTVCWPDHTWTTDLVQLNGDNLLTDEPAEGEIWEAAHDRWIAAHPNIEQVALGIYSWQRLEVECDDEEGWIDSHSVNCLACGALVDERKCLPGPDGEGDICPTCIAKRNGGPHEHQCASDE